MLHPRFLITALLAFGLLGRMAHAQIQLTQIDSPLVFDFQDYQGSGVSFDGSNGTLNANLLTLSFFGNTEPTQTTEVLFDPVPTDPADLPVIFGLGTSDAGISSTLVNGLYAAQTGGGNTALGISLIDDSYTQFDASFTVQNQTNRIIDVLEVSFDVYFRNYSDAIGSAEIQFREPGETFIDPTLFETPGPADATGQPTDGDWQVFNERFDIEFPFAFDSFDPITFLSTTDFIEPLDPGDELELTFTYSTDIDLSGIPADAVAFDNITITARSIPEPSSTLAILTIGAFISCRRGCGKRR
ncbi:MAG: hypothetical protein AAF664_13200 [Planctomycetota bacterium]